MKKTTYFMVIRLGILTVLLLACSGVAFAQGYMLMFAISPSCVDSSAYGSASAAAHLTDGMGYDAPGVTINFSPNGPMGVDPSSVVTNASGFAYGTFTGVSCGQVQVTATAPSIPGLGASYAVVYVATKPTVSDNLEYTQSPTQLSASWTCYCANSTFKYAIGTKSTDPGSGYIVNWSSETSDTSATVTDLQLSENVTYYFYVKAKPPSSTCWSSAGVSDGVTVCYGLPNANLNQAAGANRSNIRWADASNTSTCYGDKFNLGSGLWTVFKVRAWCVPDVPKDVNYAIGDLYSYIAIFGGPVNGPLTRRAYGNLTAGSNTCSNGNITFTKVSYDGGADYEGADGTINQIWQVDFKNLTWGVSNGTVDQVVAVHATPRYDRLWFNHASHAETSGYPSQVHDGQIYRVTVNGTTTDTPTLVNPAPWFGGKGSDIDILISAVKN